MTAATVAFAAGLLSFATPCVLPLVPAYLSAIGAHSRPPRQALLAALPFVAGFSAVFVLFGVAAGAVGAELAAHRLQIAQASGILIVAMGFATMGLLPVPILQRTMQPGLEPARASGSAMLLGGAFGLCWTPCVGPVLASILAIAASGASGAAEGAGLLAAYAAGLAVPFLATSVALGQAMRVSRFVRDRYDAVRLLSGVVLVGAGLLVFFDRVYVVNAWVERVL
jgi:cytochrome c-type biogenesis protein